LLFILCNCIAITKSQVLFNKNFDYNTNAANGVTNLAIIDDTIYCNGSHFNFDSLNNYIGGGFGFAKHDISGNLVSFKSFNKVNTNYYLGGNGYGSNFIHIGNYLYSVGCSQYLNQYANGLFYKFKMNGDTIFVKTINEGTSLKTIFNAALNDDNNIIAVANIWRFNSILNRIVGQTYLVKLDTLGNEIWHKEFGIEHISEYSYGIKQTIAGGYFLYGRSYAINQYSNFYLIKTDAQGNLLWERNWGNAFSESIKDVYEMPNGNILVSGFKAHQLNSSPYDTRAYLAMLNSNGSQRLWEKLFFEDIYGYSLGKIYRNTDGTYDIWGYENFDDISRPFLMKFSSTFDSLGIKYYSYWNGAGAQNYLNDIVRMPDKGYIFCGYGWQSNVDEDAWLVRIDSNGCANEACTPLAVPEVAPFSVGEGLGMRCYPNPANDEMQIRNIYSGINIKIIDAMGSLIFDQKTVSDAMIINTAAYANGIYMVMVGDTNIKISIKH